MGRRPLPAFVVAALLAAVAVIADPFPPYWTNGTGASIHYQPAAWPADAAFIAYTRIGTNIADKRDTDGSNGGTSPQGYVNVSSGCTDQAQPSVYYAYDGASQVMFFRWRVQAPPHNYATGPNAGSYASTSPWSSALWTVFMDTNGDGYRDFAVHLDGSSGSPSGAVDRIASIWSSSRSQSLDYPNDSAIHLLEHNPAAFVDGPAATDRILNFHNTLSPDASWPNGSSETTWDYGTTRATLLNTGCGEYFIDYQIPLAMLNATGVGGPQVTPTTPMSLFFATANSLQNPIQKDAVVAGDFVADPTRPIPGGDTITPSGGTIHQPTVTALAAAGCGPTTLTANVFDTLNLDRTSTVSSVVFHYYADANGDGVANDAGSAWTVAAAGTAAADPVGKWTASWNSSGLTQGRYLLAVKATDASGNVTWSQFTSQASVDAFTGGAANNFPNAIGATTGTIVNSCGAAGPSISKTVSPAFVAAGGTATFTISVANTLGSAITVSSITDVLPAGFAYASTTGTAIGTPTASPVAGDTGTIQWTFAPVTIPAATTRTLIFTATASTIAGTYTNSVSAVTSYGTLSSGATEIGVGSPSLTIAKTVSVASANPGDGVAYTIGYANDSAVSVTNAVISDVLPLGLDFVSATGGGVYVPATRTVTWTIGSIASGSGSSSVTVNTTVTTPYPGGAAIPLINTASITSTETSAASASAPLYVNAARAQLAIQKVGSASQVTAGSNVTYTLTYSNPGAAAASGVTITDPIPAGWTFVSATGGGVNSSGIVTWNIGALAAAASGSVAVVLQADASYAGANPATNTATITGTGLTPASSSFKTGVIQTGSVCNDYYFRNATTNVGSAGTQRIANTTAVTSSDTGTAISATWNSGNGAIELARFYQDPAVSSEVNFSGATVTSSIWIDRANGAGVGVTGQLFDYDPSTGATSSIGSTTTIFNGSVKGEFAFSVTPSNTLAAGHRLLWVYSFVNSQNNNSVTLVAQFGGTTANTISGGTSAALARSTICTTAPANPSIDKRVDKLVAAPGDSLTYTVAFGNAGGTNMTATQIVDTLPDGVSFVSATLNGAAVTPTATAGQQRTFTVRSSDTATSGQVTAGQTGTLVINATVPAPFTGASNTLTATAAMSSSQTSVLSDDAVTTLQRPSVTITKSADRTLLVPGDTVTYTLNVLNSGPGTAANVTVGDALPATAYFTYVANSARLNGTVISPDPVSANVLSSNIGSLAAGSSAAVTLSMAVATSGAPAGTTPISNTATVSDAGTAGSRSSNVSSVTISTNPNLVLTKASSPAAGPVAAGSSLTYTLTVSNTGSGDATGVVVRDPIPSSTTYATGTLVYAGAAQTDTSGDDTAHFDAAGNRAVFAVGTLAAGASRTLTYSVVVNSPLANGTTTLSSTATASASNAASRQATASITASAAPVLTLVKSAPASVAFPLTTLSAAATATTTITVGSAAAIGSGDVISVGGTTATVAGVSGTTITLNTAVSAASGAQVLPTWEYRLTYANTGTASATSVVIADVLPSGLTFISADSGGTNSGGTVSWNLGTVASGASGTVRVRVQPGAAAAYANTATLASAELTTVTSNTTSTSTGALTVNKSTTTPSGSTSGSVTSATYVITLQNQHPSAAATGVTVKDDLAAGFAYAGTVSIVGATASVSPAVGDTSPTWSGLSIPANSTATITFTATVSNVAPGTFQNYLTVTSGNANVLGFDALATTAEDVAIAASLGTTGVVGITASSLPGATLTITVTDPDLNADPAAAEIVQITVINTRTNESETVTLTETGISTGLFSGTLATNGSLVAGTNNAAPLNVAGGDTVRASYSDTLTSSGGAATVTADGSVVASNDAPVVTMTAAALAFTEGNSATAIDTGLTVTDVDSANLLSTTVSITGNFVTGEDVLGFTNQNGITGSFDATTGVLTLTGSATVTNYQTALRSVTYANASTNPSTSARTVSVVANDGIANSNTATRTITVAAVNNAPVVTMTAAALAFTEGDSATAIDTGLTVTDADSTNLASATASITGNFVTGEDVLGFTNQNGITGSFNATTGVLTLTGSATVANYQAALRSVTYANTSTNPSGSARTVSVVANDGTANSNTATRTITVAAVNDAPVVTMTAAALAYPAAAGPLAVDLGLTVTDADSTNLTGATMAIAANFKPAEDSLAFAAQSGITGSFNAASGVLTLSGSATLAQYQVALRSVTYTNAAASPDTAARTITLVVSDGTAASNVASRGIAVAAPPNQRPVVTTSSALAYTAGSGAVAADAGLTVSDTDSLTLSRATIAISANFAPAEDVLAFAAQNGITGSFNATTGVLTLTGSATVANYQLALRSVTYTNTNAAPSTATRTVTVVANDGQADSLPAARDISIALPSAPAMDQPGAVTVDEDSGAFTVTLTGIGAGASGGVLTVAAQPANAALFGSFAVTYTDPATSASLQFTPAPDAFGTTDVVVTVTAGGPGSGRTTSRTFRVTVAPVNDLPTLDALHNRTAEIGQPLPVALTGIGTGALNEVQTLTVTAASSNPAIVASPVVGYGTPASTGTLTLTAAAAGSAVITVTVDDGQSANATMSRTFNVTVASRVNTPPTITPIADMGVTEGSALPGASFTVGDAETPASGLTVTVRSVNATLIPQAGVAMSGAGAARTLALVNAANRIGSGQIIVTVSDGELSASTSFTATVRPLWDYYLPDGWAQSAVSTVVRATNPHGAAAPVRLTFLKPAGDPLHQLFEIPSLTRWSAELSGVAAAGAGEVSTFIRSVNNLPLLVERTMTWDADAHAGSAEVALDSTNMQWFFAEGAQGTLRTNLIIANPNDAPVTVTVTFLLESGAPVSRVYDVGPLGRRTLAFHDIPALAGQSFGMVVDATLPIAAERTTYLDAPRERQGGHSSAGVPYPSTQWYFAEGSNWKIFQSYMLLLNPGSIAANVRIEYHTMTGAHYATSHVVSPRSRLTVDTLAAEPRLDGQHFWMAVTSDQPIAAERSMYWDRGAGSLSEGHNSRGVIEPSRRWSTGDARVGGPQQFSTFVLVGNPSADPANLTITIKRDGGADIVSTLRMAPLGRDTININTAVPALSNESFWLLIDSDVPIVAERSQYWGPLGSRGSWSGGTNTFAVPVVPADYNGCAYNIGPTAAAVPAQGGRVTINVGATSRCTFTAEPTASWLRIAAGDSGSGVSTVVVRVEPNASSTARTGTIAIAGKAVTITQDAAPAAGVGQPLMALDTPLDGARVGSVFRVSGWAVDLAAMDQTAGVETVHVWAYPNPGSNATAVFLGVADYGHDRPDLEHIYGERTRRSGFSLTVRGLEPGRYQIVVFAYSKVTNSFSQARAATVTVAFDSRIVIDTPIAGRVALPAVVAGWAAELNSEGESGIDAVHVWAYPAGGGAAVFAGAASVGHARPDVAAAFARPGALNSGYAVTLRTLDPGAYQLVVFAKRTGAASFDLADSVAIDIVDAPRRFLVVDTPAELQVVGPSFMVAGWAADVAAETGPGVDTVHIWAHPTSGGGATVFLGAAHYGTARPDVARYLGAQFENSGFSLSVTGLPPGTYRIEASAHSSVTGAFDHSRNRMITVTPAQR